jgi:hypothetical protein
MATTETVHLYLTARIFGDRLEIARLTATTRKDEGGFISLTCTDSGVLDTIMEPNPANGRAALLAHGYEQTSRLRYCEGPRIGGLIATASIRAMPADPPVAKHIASRGARSYPQHRIDIEV